MTFVANPYSQFADDVLTALTGGVVREEHRFTGVEETYSLGTPGALVSSLKVFGQKNGVFIVFERGVDYEFDEANQSISWKKEGKLPDDRSFFYVNYYLTDASPRLTDRNVGSVISILAESFAREYAVLNKQMELIYKSAFVETAEGVSLDHVAVLLGLERKDSQFAIGKVIFTRSTPAPADINIPAGTLVSTMGGKTIIFETTDDRILRRGQLSAEVPIRARVKGNEGRVDSNTITNVNRPIFGLEQVINKEATFFANEKEIDEEFRRRIKMTLERAGRSTINAIKFGLIDAISEIKENNIQVLEDPETSGFVKVMLALDNPPEPDFVNRIEEVIFNHRPAGIRVVHNLPTRSQTESEARTAAEARKASSVVIKEIDGAHGLIPLLPNLAQPIPETGDITFYLKAEVRWKPSSEKLSPAQKAQIEDKIKNIIVDHIENLAIGEEIIYNKILGKIAILEEIRDVRLRIGLAEDSVLRMANILVADRKARIIKPPPENIPNISIGLMEETVKIEVTVKVVKVKPIEGIEGKSKTGIPQNVKKAIEDAVNRGFLETQNKIEQNQIKLLIQQALAQTTPQYVLIDSKNFLLFNAEFEESGSLLNSVATVELASHQVPKIGDIFIEEEE